MSYLLKAVVVYLSILHVTVAEEVFYGKVGEDIALDVSFDPSTYLYWFFNGAPIASINTYGRDEINPEWKNRLTLSRKQLVIKNVSQNIFGTFSCEVKDRLKVLEKKDYKLIEVRVDVNSRILLPGQSLSLTCETVNSQNKPRIYWKTPKGVQAEGGSLTISGTTALHSGDWTCVIDPAKRRKETKVKVTVIDLLPDAPIPTMYTSKSTSLSIPCSLPTDINWDIIKTKEIQEVGWYFCRNSATNLICNKSNLFSLILENKPTWKSLIETMLRPSPNPGNGNLSLGKNNWRQEDGGDYVCFMKFENDVTLSRTTHVEVLQIIASPGTELISGQALNLTCTTGRPLPPDLQVKWIPPKNNAPLHAPLIHDPQITVPEVSREDRGTWKCELWREKALLTSAAVALNIEPKISDWMLATIGAAAVVLVLLVILILILYRRRQRRTRRHKPRLCKCKNPKPKGFYRS